jgi:hypothetical protein
MAPFILPDRVEHKIRLEQPFHPSIIKLFLGHVWEESSADKPCPLTNLNRSLIAPPLSVATDQIAMFDPYKIAGCSLPILVEGQVAYQFSILPLLPNNLCHKH